MGRISVFCCAVAAALLAATSLAAPASAGTASWTQIASWKLGRDGLGKIRIGMTVSAVQRVTGRALIPEYGFPGCQIWTLAGAPGGLGIMTAYGRVARIDIRNRRWQTARGIRIGDKGWEVKRRYGVRASGHEYTRGQYLVTRGKRRIVFETSSTGKVTRFRAGRPPHVEYVEGCL